jgi:hypothetical protein
VKVAKLHEYSLNPLREVATERGHSETCHVWSKAGLVDLSLVSPLEFEP